MSVPYGACMHTTHRCGASATVIHPGDMVLIGINRQLTLEEVELLADRLKERFPDNDFGIIDQVSSIAVFRSLESPVSR